MQKIIILNVALLAATSLWCMEKISIEKKDVLSSPKITLEIEKMEFDIPLEDAYRSQFIKNLPNLQEKSSEVIVLPFITNKIWSKYINRALKKGEEEYLLPNIQEDDDLIALTSQANFLDIPFLYKQATELLSNTLKSRLTQDLEKKVCSTLSEDVQQELANQINDQWYREKIYEGREARHFEFNHDGTLLAISDSALGISICNVETQQHIAAIKKSPQAPPLLIASHPHKNILFIADAAGNITIFDVPSQKTIDTFAGDGAYQILLSPDGTALATVSQHFQVNLWNLQTKQATALGKKEKTAQIAFNRKGTKLIIAERSRNIEIYDTAACKLLTTIKNNNYPHHPGEPVRSVSCTDTLLAIGKHDGYIDMWDISVETPKFLNQLRHSLSDTDIHSVHFDQTGKVLASASKKEIKLWDISHARMIEEIQLPIVHNGTQMDPIIKFDKQNRLWITIPGHKKIERWKKISLNLTAALLTYRIHQHQVFDITKLLPEEPDDKPNDKMEE
jgi:WD40 repeat protein